MNHATKGEPYKYSFQFVSYKQFHAYHQTVNLPRQIYFKSPSERHIAGTEVKPHAF
jgi:hypothetical protein